MNWTLVLADFIGNVIGIGLIMVVLAMFGKTIRVVDR